MTITMSGKTIGENIKLARMQAGISRAKLAEELCVSEVMVYKYETDSAKLICSRLQTNTALRYLQLRPSRNSSRRLTTFSPTRCPMIRRANNGL